MSHILIDKDGLCYCNCATKCVLGRMGSQYRCNKQALNEAGYKTVQAADDHTNLILMKALISGSEGKITIPENKKTDWAGLIGTLIIVGGVMWFCIYMLNRLAI